MKAIRWMFFAAMAALLASCAAVPGHMAGQPPIRYVFVIVLENEPFEVTFNENSIAPYLAHELPAQGALLQNYYAIGHLSLDNYIAMISGQAPNKATQDDCKTFVDFVRTSPGLDANGQAAGEGCVYPADVKTLPDQLEAAGLTWKGYMEDMGADPSREAAACGHVAVGAVDHTSRATPQDQYAAKHNPFVYFHSIIDDQASWMRSNATWPQSPRRRIIPSSCRTCATTATMRRARTASPAV